MAHPHTQTSTLRVFSLMVRSSFIISKKSLCYPGATIFSAFKSTVNHP
jgi:hypothetical protein